MAKFLPSNGLISSNFDTTHLKLSTHAYITVLAFHKVKIYKFWKYIFMTSSHRYSIEPEFSFNSILASYMPHFRSSILALLGPVSTDPDICEWGEILSFGWRISGSTKHNPSQYIFLRLFPLSQLCRISPDISHWSETYYVNQIWTRVFPRVLHMSTWLNRLMLRPKMR